MRIGIDARMYGPRQAGLGRYIEQLVLNLEKMDTKNEYIIFLRKTNWNDYESSRNNFKKVLADMPWYSWQEQIKLKKIIKKEKVDLMHFPHWNVPLFYSDPFVVTIHDLIMYHYPRQEASTHGFFVYWFKDLLHRLVVYHAVKKARQIIVTSEFTKYDIHRTLKVPLKKMTVIYQAPFERNKEQGVRSNGEIIEKFGINRKYVLYVGNAYPHKNLEGLLKAWKIFEEKYSSDYQLVFCGKENYFYKRLKSLALDLKSIVFTGFVSDEELISLYQNASLYVFPSLYEGFGLPPLEAMIYDVPVVSSNSTCLPEILNEAALYFDPVNYEQMAEIIYRGLTDENIRFELQKNIKSELTRFSINKMATDTLAIYLSVNIS